LEKEVKAGFMRTKGDVELDKLEILKTDTSGSGFAIEKEYTPAISNINKITPNVKLQQVIDFTVPSVKEAWMSDDIVVKNAEGLTLPLKSLTTLEERIDAANRFGAVKILQPETDLEGIEVIDEGTGLTQRTEITIPWDNLIYDMSRVKDEDQVFSWRQNLPEDQPGIERSVFMSKPFKNMTSDDIDNFLQWSMAGSIYLLDPEVRKPMYADFMNRRLIRSGIEDARTRAAIIKYGVNAPLMGDLEKIAAGVGENAIRLPLEMILGLVGETLDVAEDIFSDNVYINKGDEDAGYLDIRHPSRRQAIMDTVWQSFTHRFIDRMAQRGVTVSLAQAEAYRDTLTGALPRLVKTTGEFAIPSSVASRIQVLKGTNELKRFRQYVQENVENGSKKSYDDMATDYIALRSESSLPLLGKFKESSINAKLSKAYQVEDSKMAKNLRAEVVAADGYIKRLQTRKKDLELGDEARIARGQPSALDRDRMEALDIDIANAIVAKQAAEKFSGMPKFMRDANLGFTTNPQNMLKSQDSWMILGAASTGHYFQQQYDKYDWKGDPMMGEAAGMATGLIMSIIRGNTKQMLAAFNNSATGQLLFSKMPWAGGKSKTMFDKWIVQNASNLSPELQEGLIERVRYLDKLKGLLEREGVRADVLSDGFASLTGFTTLKAIEDVARQSLSMADAKSFKISDMETIAQHQKRFLEELTGVLYALGDTVPNTVKDDFAKMIKNTVDDGTRSVKELQDNIDIIDKHGITYYLDIINGNSKKYANQMDVDSKQSFVTAADDLAERNLVKVGELNRTDFMKNVTEPRDMVAKVVEQNANNVRSKMVDAASSEFRGSFPNQKVAVTGKKIDSDIINFDKPGDMLSGVLEHTHVADKAVAKRPFALIDSASTNNTFVTANGAKIKGDITVDVGDVFSSIFSGRPDALKKLRAEGRDIAGLDQEFIDVSNPFFRTLGEADNLSVKEVVSKIKKTMEDPNGPYKVTFVKGLSDQTQVVQYLRQFGGEGVGDFRVPFTRLAEFEATLSGLAYKASRAGLPDDAKKYETARNLVIRKFDEFEAVGENGELIPVEKLHIKDGDEIRPVATVLAEGKSLWRGYKLRWYSTTDGNVIPSLMSWGNREILKKSTVDYPAGVRYFDSTEKWIDIKALSNPDNTADLNAFSKSMRQALGKEQLDGTIQFVEGDPMTQAFSATMRTSITEYITGQQGRFNANELMDRVSALEAAFTVVGRDGKPKPMFKMQSVFDDIAYSTKSVSDETHEAAEAMKNNAIKSQLSKTLEPAKKLVQVKQEAVNFLKSYSVRIADINNAGEIILSGGETGLAALRQNLKGLGRSDAEIDAAVTDVVTDYIARSSLIDTGSSSIKGNVNTKDIAFNPVSLLEKIGANDPERAKLIRKIVGDERYEVFDAIARIASERSVKRDSLNITGIPRSFSVESYISRFYAINRGVISPRYVGTEAVLQQFRNSRFDIFHTMLTDPKVGEAFVEMVRTGKPLSPEREVAFFNALAASLALNTNTALVMSGIKPNTTIEDRYGQRFVMDPFPRIGGPIKTGPDASIGEGKDIPLFKEFEKRKKDFPIDSVRMF
jgi:hypothetical protein